MSEKHVVVQGASLKCNFSVEPKVDKLKVLSHKMHYANDKEGSEKLIATTMEIGQTMEKNTFGKCKLQPTNSDFLPCMAVITQWTGFYKDAVLSNMGKVLLEDSKATCPIGGPGCISIQKHGQKAEGSAGNFSASKATVTKQLNPMANSKVAAQEDFKNGLITS